MVHYGIVLETRDFQRQDSTLRLQYFNPSFPVFDFISSTTLVQMMPLLSKLLVHEWNKHNSIKVLYLFFVYCWVILLQHDKIHNYTLKRGLLYMMSKRSLSSKPMHYGRALCVMPLFCWSPSHKSHLISLIIILRVSFCSDIGYCNILTYYLGNILAYYQDN